MPRPIPPPLAVALTALRRRRGWTVERLAEEAGLSAKMIGHYESGYRTPAPARVERLVTTMGYGLEAVDFLLFGLQGAEPPAAEHPGSPVEPTLEERQEARRVAARVGLASIPLTERHLVQAVRARRARQARREAVRLCDDLLAATPAERRLFVESCRELHTWAVAEELCHRSTEAASHRADLALELAGLAHRVAELMPGEDLWRGRVEGYTLFFVANAHRVSNHMDEAGTAFTRAIPPWEAGAGADPGLLPEWRRLDLEGSLRRDQRRFPEALDRLDRALAAAPREVVGRILVNKAFTLEQMGEAERAIATLREAAPRVDGRRDPNLLFGLQFNLAANACRLDQFREAELLLPRIRELAIALRKELHLLRVRWIEGRVATGLGRTADAQAAFEQVRRELTTRGMAYDCALVTLELATLHLEQGRTREARRLAKEMVWIFRAQGIHREALAALRLFRDAALREAATAELARRTVRYLDRARFDPDLRFEA